MSKNFKDKVNEKCNQFFLENGKIPTKLYLNHKAEGELAALNRSDIGNLAGDIMLMGVRKAVEKWGGCIMGLKVNFDAEEFKVE